MRRSSKPNAAFYEDTDGWRALRETVAYAHGKDVPVLLDAKRADIGNTARQYAQVLDDVDAITVNPYLGEDALQPFLSRSEAGVFVLCRTSNPGGMDFQHLELAAYDRRLYEHVAERAAGGTRSTATSASSSARRRPTNWKPSGSASPSCRSSCRASAHRAATRRPPSSTA